MKVVGEGVKEPTNTIVQLFIHQPRGAIVKNIACLSLVFFVKYMKPKQGAKVAMAHEYAFRGEEPAMANFRYIHILRGHSKQTREAQGPRRETLREINSSVTLPVMDLLQLKLDLVQRLLAVSDPSFLERLRSVFLRKEIGMLSPTRKWKT